MKKNGYVIIVEWEAHPEKRFKQATLEEVTRQIPHFYYYPEIPGFEMIKQGYSPEYTGPFIVYQKM